MRFARRRVLGAACLGTGAVVLLVWLRCGSIPADLLANATEPSTVVVDRHGEVLYEALSSAGARLERIDARSIPPVLAAATLAAEDRRFYSHPGVDVVALFRAVRQNLSEGRVVEGGSTISQQVAKLLIQRREGVHPRTFRSKTRETVLALRLEHRFSKAEILALYLNLASYGNQVSGAARASRMYFGVEPGMLTPAQAAFLAGLPQRPSAFNPWRSFASANRRQQIVLRRMAASGALTPAGLKEAIAERIAIGTRRAPYAAPHLVDMVVASAAASHPSRIETTIDLELQRDIEGIIDAARPALRAHGAANVAVVVLDNRRAEWLAWEGSGDYFDAEHGGAINGPLVPRQPGSALKPFTYALSFERGDSPATVLADIPSHFPTAEAGVVYSPRNYDNRYRGPLRARSALAGSENVPAVTLASDLGVSTLLRFLNRAGLSTFDHPAAYYGLGLTLGNAEVRLDELVAAYSIFPRGGTWMRPTFLKESSRTPYDERPVVSQRTAFWITDVLSDPAARAFIFGRGGNLEFPFPVAVKTGTSQAYHDNWTIGYTRDVTVGVWVGNFDRTPLRDSSGVTGAGPIFHAVMLAAVQRAGTPANEGDAIVARPADLVPTTICTLSGMRATGACPSRQVEWLPASHEAPPCSWHHASDEGLVTIYPPEYSAWTDTPLAQPSRAARHASRAPAVATRGGGTPLRYENKTRAPLEIVSPPAGATYSIDPTLRREYQALTLRALTEQPENVTWLVDGRVLGTVGPGETVSWPLVVGAHEIEARDAAGHTARAAVSIR